jgi:acyl-[acyl carrier protein]--UDP-N-acetylglucosamine O-acyltransferase
MLASKRTDNVIRVATMEAMQRKLRRLGCDVKEATVEDISFKLRHFKRHTNKDGSVGGFVESTAKVAEYVFLAKGAMVLDNANVRGDVRVENEATLAGNANVHGNARIRDRAYVGGDATVCDYADVSGVARIFQCAVVYERAKIFGDALLFGYVVVGGDVIVAWHSQLCGKIQLRDGPAVRYG